MKPTQTEKGRQFYELHKRPSMFLIRSIIGFIIVFGAALSADAQPSTNWSNRVVSKEIRPLSYWFSHGGEDVNELIIDGRRFDHVRGIKKFYLEVDKLPAIVFVVNEKDYSTTFHVFRMDTDEDIAIRADSSVFGQTIGSAHPRDSVELASDGKVILSTFDTDVKNADPTSKVDAIKSIFYLDLQKKAVVARKTLYYSADKLIGEGHWP
jgi:hypothetical protein